MDRRQRNYPLPPLTRPWLYAITDGSGHNVLVQVAAAAQAGLDFIQIREPLLSDAALVELARTARAQTPSSVHLLLNRRPDLALAAELDGVHLPALGLPTEQVRAWAPPGFLIARSCHSLAEVEAASSSGVNFCVLGPIYPTPDKGPPLGLDALQQASRCGLPILALGGVTAALAAACLAHGAQGLAGIRLFVPSAVAATAAALRNLPPSNCVE